MRIRVCAAMFLCLSLSRNASADVALLLAEPYGPAGNINPVGHVGVYLTRICAASPTVLRRCEPGEQGVVISRYNQIAGLDWIAIPLIPYLYSVERADQVPGVADAATVASLRNQYRLAHLGAILPNSAGNAPPDGKWTQLTGAAYDRRFVVFRVDTTEAQDEALIERLNSQPNKRRFNILFRNCADFARDIINFYYPNALRSNFIADLGVTTPKQVVKSLVKYDRRQPNVEISTFGIAQISGSGPKSKKVRGVVEALVRSKKYLVPLFAMQPWLPAGLATAYVTTGRFNPDRYAVDVYLPAELERRATFADWR